MLKRSNRVRLALAGLVLATAVGIVVAISGGSSDSPRRCGTNEPNTGWGVGMWPDGCWRPYADDSPFNQRLAANPRVDPRSDQIVARLTEGGGPSDLRAEIAHTPGDNQHPTYWSTKDDPEFDVTCTRAFGRCEVEGMHIRIPDRARPAGGSDKHLTVVDQDSGWEYDFWEVESKPTGGGVLRVGYGGRTRIDGDGLGSDSTAAHFGNLAGIIRAPELQRGRIDHALFVVADCDSGQIVYPAMGRGAPCSDRTDAPSEGTRFQLDMTEAEIRALGAPRWKRAILRAMVRYGMFVGDTGGSPWDLEFESGSTYTSFNREDPMVDIATRAGILRERDGYHFELSKGVDWRSRLRVVDPCVSERTCE